MAKKHSQTKVEDLESNSKPQAPQKSKKIIVLITTILLLLLVGGGNFAYLYNKKQPLANVNEPNHLVFMTLPEILVNLRSHKAHNHILKATFVLQLYKKNEEEGVKNAQPVIVDQIVSYLREQMISDLEGAGLERVKQALLERINAILSPLKIHKLMIKEFIMQ